MVTYDVIVAGAGPAGSTSARECAARGLSVVLLDRAEFPREKPCGGGVNIRSARLLPFSLESVAERTIYGLSVSVRQQNMYLRRSSYPLSYLTQRKKLDTLLVEMAVRSGVELRERSPVAAVEQTPREVVVRAGKQMFAARVLIAADGANGPTTRLSGLDVDRWLGIALEANVSPEIYPRQWEDVFAVDLGTVPGGYGWLFPKGDHLNVGVGGWHSTGPTLRRRLQDLSRFYGFDPVGLWDQRGHPLPTRRTGSPLVKGNVLAVGDAAGLLDPLTGEGIYAAIWSGGSAARHVARFLDGRAPDLMGYQREVEGDLIAEQQISLQLRDLFHVNPALPAVLFRRSHRLWTVICSLLTGEQTYGMIKTRFPGMATGIDLASDLVRLIRHGVGAEGAEDTPYPEHALSALAQILPSGQRREMKFIP